MKSKREHQYYYQVQQQLFTTELPFCDFIVCGFNDKGGSFINERIMQDKEHWENNVPKLSQFWRYRVLPEILGRWYTRKSNLLKQSTDPKAVCFCGMDTDESLEKYSNPFCQISLFHPSYLKISQVPKVLYCPNGQKFPEFKKKSKNMEQNEVVLRAQEKNQFVSVWQSPKMETN